MREEVKRISKLVAEGRLSPDDAADLIDAFYASERADQVAEEEEEAATTEEVKEPEAEGTTPPPPPRVSRDPFKGFIDNIEKLTKEGIESVNWQEVSRQAKIGAKKGLDAVRAGLDDISKGKVNLGWLNCQESREISLPLAVPVGKTLRVENTAGDVKIVGGNQLGSVTADARIKGATIEEARAKAASYTLIIEESDHYVLIKQPDVPGLSVDLNVVYPGTGPIEIRSQAGDIDVENTGGGCRINARSGDVNLKGLNGVIEVTLGSGDVSVREAETPSLVVEGQSGDINVEAVNGNLNLRTASGDIEVTKCHGKVVAVESVTGNVHVDLAEPVAGSVNIRTMSGDGRVQISGGSDCRVSLSTLRGSVNSSVTLDNEARTEQRITGQLGAGVGSLDVSAVTGNITLELRDATQA